MRERRNRLVSLLILCASLLVSLAIGEAALRLKNSSQTNYDIEMWRYAKELKTRSSDVALDLNHVRSRSARLEKVEIRLNEWGLRGGPILPLPQEGRRILFLGGSITLGWGVPEPETVESRLEEMLRPDGKPVQVLNGGVGNYNAERYVSRFFSELTPLRPTDIVVHYFLRDAEELPPSSGSVLLRNSQLAVTLWIAYQRFLTAGNEKSPVEYYSDVYRPDAPGFIRMKHHLERLAEHARAHHIRTYLVMMPDVHNLTEYQLGFVHDLMREIAQQQGYTYVDLLPSFRGRKPEELWALPGDPHPNSFGHRLMAEAIYPILAGK